MSSAPPVDPLTEARAHHKAGRLNEAESGYRQVLQKKPGHPAALHGLGLVNHQSGRQDEAISLLRQAVALVPDAPDFRANLAAVLGRMGRHGEAVTELREAVRITPAYMEGWFNLGVALEKSGKPEDAIKAYRQAISLRPDSSKSYNFMGIAMRRAGQWAEAEAAQREAVRLDPNDPTAYANLATTLSGLGSLDDVVMCRRKVAELRPRSSAAGSALLSTLQYPATSSRASLLAEARNWAERHAKRFSDAVLPHENEPTADRPLRIGFFSGSVTAHPEGRFLRPVLAHLDRDVFQTYVYSATGKPDSMTAVLRQICDQWREIGATNDTKAAQLIREDRIDILVDLSGHFGNNRIQLFARKPAPVQVIHFGYPGTSGLNAMDWRITDALVDPAEDGEAYTTEALWRMPDFAWCYEPPIEARAVAARPRAKDGAVTFACVNNTIKVTPEAIATWSRIMSALPGSRLELLAEGRKATTDADDRGQHLLKLFAQQGIARDRIVLVSRQARGKYFEWIHSADIALDPFPYNGGVTTCDTLWMGVPVVTMRGDSYRSRQGVGLLKQVGMEELVAGTRDEYVQIAVELARDADRLAAARATLRDRMRKAPVTDCATFGRNLGQVYKTMWKQWCESRPQSPSSDVIT